MDQRSVMFIVSGRVQGVGFRYYTSQQGQTLGLTGYAKNLANGDVEVFVSGEKESIKLMADWLEQGPKTATVDKVEVQQVEYQSMRGFLTY